MCIIALTKPGVMLSADHLRAMFQSNPHGAGMAWIAKDGRVEWRKGFMKEKEFLDGYQHNILDSAAYMHHPVMLHCRIATLGKISSDNCHPFKVKDGVVAHNGTLWHGADGDPMEAEKSDTREYMERLHNVLAYEELMVCKHDFKQAINYNKLAFLFKGGKYVIINEKEGSWRDNVWYSNLNWMRNYVRIAADRQHAAQGSTRPGADGMGSN